jgi:hypothetical protein
MPVDLEFDLAGCAKMVANLSWNSLILEMESFKIFMVKYVFWGESDILL